MSNDVVNTWAFSTRPGSDLDEAVESATKAAETKSEALREIARAGLGLKQNGENAESDGAGGYTMHLSEFEMRVIGNRVWEAGERYEQSGFQHAAEECRGLARRFHAEIPTRSGEEPES